MSEQIIEIDFPLNEEAILSLLKGCEYNKIVTRHLFEENSIKVHVKVFLDERVKYISRENWQRIIYASYSNPELMQLIQKIDSQSY